MAVGVVLSEDENPIAYFTENMNDAKKKSSDEKEFDAMILDLKKWKHYLMPKEFILYTNNNILQCIS